MRRNCIVALLALVAFVQLSAADDDGMCSLDAPKDSCKSGTGEDGHQYTEAENVAEKVVEGITKPGASIATNGVEKETMDPYWEGKTTIHLGCVVCNDRAPEALTMLKSALMFSRSPLRYYIFVEDHLRGEMATEMDSWLDVRAGRVKYSMYKVQYPAGEDGAEWRKLFKPCATMRLFIPTNTPKSLDSIIYLDTDTLVVSPLEDLWAHFARFNSTQLAAMTPEGEDPNAGWYNRFAMHPYYGTIGVNSGVMPMNLTRIRSADDGKWRSEMVEIYHTYRYNLTWGDQDILNIYFHRHPERLYVYPCEWNYRPDHCMYMSNCMSAERNGCKVLHGNRGTLHNEKQPAFRAINQAFKDHLATNEVSKESLLGPLKKLFKDVPWDGCGEVRALFMRSLEKSLEKLQNARHQS